MTPLKQKYAQVSDGCWESPTAVQVGLSWSRGPADVGHCLEGWYTHFRHRVVPLFLKKNQYKGKAHACVGNYGVCTAQRFSAQRAAYERDHAGNAFFWQMSFVLTVCVCVPCSFNVCVKRSGPPPWALTYFVGFLAFRLQSLIADSGCWKCF